MKSHNTKSQPAEVLCEYGPYPTTNGGHGVTFCGERAWFARGGNLAAIDSESGGLVRELAVAAAA